MLILHWLPNARKAGKGSLLAGHITQGFITKGKGRRVTGRPLTGTAAVRYSAFKGFGWNRSVQEFIISKIISMKLLKTKEMHQKNTGLSNDLHFLSMNSKMLKC